MPLTGKEVLFEKWRQGYDCSTIPSLGHAGSFWNAILQLFRKLLRAERRSHHSTIAPDLFAKFVGELQRFYFWGEGFSASQGRLDEILDKSTELQHDTIFILEQLGRALSVDLCTLLNANSALDPELIVAVKEVDDMHKVVATLLRTTDDELDPDLGSGFMFASRPEFEITPPDAHDILGDITDYIDSLMDLCDALENTAQDADWLHDRDAAVNPESFDVLPEADQYCRRIRDQYPFLPRFLVERLGNLNSKRYSRLRYWGNHTIAQGPDLDREDSKPSVSGDPTTETRSSTVFDKDSWHGDAMSLSTAETTDFGNTKGKPRVPPLPAEAKDGAPFRCPICHIIVSGITSRAEWKKHVFGDLRPYCCVAEDCNLDSRGETVYLTYSSTGIWIQHLTKHFKTAFSGKCPFCGPSSPLLAQQKLVQHIRRHLQDISLSVLPQSSQGIHDSDDHDEDEIKDVTQDLIQGDSLHDSEDENADMISIKSAETLLYSEDTPVFPLLSKWDTVPIAGNHGPKTKSPGETTAEVDPDEIHKFLTSLDNPQRPLEPWIATSNSYLYQYQSERSAVMRPREGVNRPLWCEFTGLLYCSQTFRLADEEDWIQHHLDHLGNNAPETSMCWFCDDHIFAADRPIDTNARFAKFRQRMRHIRDHIIHNPRLTENVMRPDFHLINEIHSRGLLSENMYQHAKAYDELPDAYKLPGSTSSPPSSSWQPRDKPQFVLESRRSRRRRSRERRKGTAKKVEGEADAA